MVCLLLRVLAASQMQTTDARRVFPCFDEPAMKAVFHITLIHPPGTVALSNSVNFGLFLTSASSSISHLPLRWLCVNNTSSTV